MITWSCQSVWLHNNHSLARHCPWQTHLPDRFTCLPQQSRLHVQYQRGTRGRPVEMPAETPQTSIRLASQLVRAPNSRSGGHEFESLFCKNSAQGLEVKRPLRSGLSTMRRIPRCDCKIMIDKPVIAGYSRTFFGRSWQHGSAGCGSGLSKPVISGQPSARSSAAFCAHCPANRHQHSVRDCHEAPDHSAGKGTVAWH